MGFCAAFLFSFLIGIASCQDSSICDSSEDSLVPVTIFVTAEQYRACREDGDCSFNSRCVEMAGHGEIQGSLEGKSYFEVCQKVHSQMEQLEAENPDVKRLKIKMMEMIDSFSIEFGSSEGELVSTKILNFLKNSIEKLKVELEEESNKVHKPESIPVLKTTLHEEEVTAEPEHESDHWMLVGSIRGIPGIHFPNYTEIPITSFSCSGKTIPGFYADLETGCQVFHLCYEHRRESFLCPVGTIFNQPILACDYWYSANCSQSSIVITKEITIEEIEKHHEKDEVKDVLKFLPVKAKVTYIPTTDKPVNPQEFKSSVTLESAEVVADKIFDGILSIGGHATSIASDKLKKIGAQHEIPMSKSYFPLKAKLATKASVSIPLVKAKKITSAAVAAAVPIKAKKVATAAAVAAAVPIKAKKVATAAAVAAAVPIKAKKVATAAAVAAAVPIKAKKVATAAAVAAAVPIKAKKVATAAAVAAAVPIKAKITLPIIKTKVASAAIPLGSVKVASKKFPIVKGKLFKLPLAKTKLGVAAIPAVKAKKAKALPYLKMAALKPKIAIAPLKAKSAAVFPFMKAKLAKAAISPLTKKTLALGYLKLLKAKKLAVMG